MIEIKLATIVNSVEILQKIANSPIKGKTAYKVAKLLRKIEEEMSLFNDGRTKIIDYYAIKDEDNKPIVEDGNFKIDPNKITEFNKEVDNLLNTTISINANPIPLEEIEEIEFTPNEMALIEPFIQE